jgi:hypothetical protein
MKAIIMNYKKHYDALCDRARQRAIGGYFERHHVIPRCMGGANNKDNIVKLTPEEHYIAHQLLVKIYPDNPGLVWAITCMTANWTGNRSNKVFGWVRKQCAIASSGENNPFYGKKHSDETKIKIQQSLTGQSKAKGHDSPNYGKKHSDETKIKISEANKGDNNGFYGKNHSDEFKAKHSARMKGRNKGRHWRINSMTNKREWF